jgi:hypothetical protein
MSLDLGLCMRSNDGKGARSDQCEIEYIERGGEGRVDHEEAWRLLRVMFHRRFPLKSVT